MTPSSPSKSSKRGQWLSLGVGTAITIILLSWAFRDISFVSVGQNLQKSRLEWLLLAWVAYLATYGVRASRWGVLLDAIGPSGAWRSRFSATLIGFGASSILPGHAGEFLRPLLLHRFDGIPKVATFGSIFVERLLDVGIVFILLLIPCWLNVLPDHPALNHLGLRLIGSIIIAAWVLLLIGASTPKTLASWAGKSCHWLGLGTFESKIVGMSHRFLGGLGALRSPRHTLLALLQTVAIWLLNGVTYWAALVAFGIWTPGFLGALFVQSSTALAIALPSTPGYIGPFEAGVRGSLDIFGIPGELSIACAVALRLIMYGTIPILAGLLALHLGLSWTDVRAQNVKAPPSQFH